MAFRKNSFLNTRNSVALDNKMPEHVIGVFTRVLERNRDTRVSKILDDDLHGLKKVKINFRDNTFTLAVSAYGRTMCLHVSKTDSDRFEIPFFQYSCPIHRLGRLRKTALILQKKMNLIELYEVHDC